MKTIKENELQVLIPVIIKTIKKPTKESVMKQITLIDDLLTLQKSRMLFMPKRTKSGILRKDVGLKKIIEARIDTDI